MGSYPDASSSGNGDARTPHFVPSMLRVFWREGWSNAELQRVISSGEELTGGSGSAAASAAGMGRTA